MMVETPARPYSRFTAGLVVALAAVILGVWLIGTPGGVLGKADAVGYAICHRIPGRSFHLGGRALPLCARCTGIYLGVMMALVTYGIGGRARVGRLPNLKIMAVLLLSVVAIGVDGLNSYLSLFPFYTPVYEPHNTLRLITGTFAGLTLITLVLPIYNTTVWRTPSPIAPLNSFRELALLVVIAALVITAVLVEWPPLLFLFALISVAGVVLMFTIIGSVVFLLLTGRDADAISWRDLALPALAGLAFAFLVIGAIDAARYALTGTWEGFTILG